jgi:hypothetical protein
VEVQENKVKTRTTTTSTRSQPAIGSSLAVKPNIPGKNKFLFEEDERQRLVAEAQKQLNKKAAEEIPDGAEELIGMQGLEFSDDEGSEGDSEELDVGDIEIHDSEELDVGDIEIHDVPMSTSEVLLYQVPRVEPEKVPKAGTLSLNFFDSVTQEINALPEVEEPEFIEVEMTLDTGATVHAADREDLPCHVIEESPGSRAGQQFQAAGGKLIPNEGQAIVEMLAPGTDSELVCSIQIAKVTRPLLSVTKMTESGKISVLCKKEEALVLDENNKVLARFTRKGGLYTAIMRVRNPRFQPFPRPGR